MISCARCDKKLGVRKIKPRFDWQIEGKICTECNRHISDKTSYHEAEYKEDEPDFPNQKGILAIQNFDDKRRILFIAKNSVQFEILLRSIQKIENIDYTEKSTKKKISTLGLKDELTSKHIRITFVGKNGVYSPLFQIKDPEDVEKLLDLCLQKYHEESQNISPPQEMIDAIKNARGMQFVNSDISEKLNRHSVEIKKIKKFLNPNEHVLYVTKQEKEKQKIDSATNADFIFATDKRLIIKNITKFGAKNIIQDLPYENITSLTLRDGPEHSTLILEGAEFADIDTISQASLQRYWGVEKETTMEFIPKTDATEFSNILREQIEKNGVKNLKFNHVAN